MTITGLIDFDAVKAEIINYLRANLSDAKNRGTTTLATLNGTGSATAFLINVPNVKSIINVEHPVNTVLTFGSAYTFDTDYNDSGTYKTRIVFSTPPASGTANIEVNYKYGSTWIYPDYDQTQSTLKDFPKIVVDILLGSTIDEALDGSVKNTVLTISITVYDYDTGRIDATGKEIRNLLLDKQKTWYYSKYITPSNISALINTPDSNQKIFQRTFDFDSLFNYEVLS